MENDSKRMAELVETNAQCQIVVPEQDYSGNIN
jgi:hypothetical protein